MTEVRKQDILLITLLGTAHGLSHYFHLIIPPLFPWIMPEFGTSFAEMGAVMTVFFITSSLGQAVSGIVVDKLGPRVCLYGGVSLLMIAGFLFSFAQNYWWFFPVAACAGLGNSVFHPTDFSIINRCISSERLPFAFSIHFLVGNVGWALAPIIMVGVAGLTGSWRMAAATAGLMALLVLIALVLHNSLFAKALSEGNGLTPEEKKADEKADVGFRFLKLLVVWLCFLFFFCNSFALGILQNFAPSIFNATYHVGLEIATSGLTAYMIGSIVGAVLGAYVAKAFKCDRCQHVAFCADGHSFSISVVRSVVRLTPYGCHGVRCRCGDSLTRYSHSRCMHDVFKFEKFGSRLRFHLLRYGCRPNTGTAYSRTLTRCRVLLTCTHFGGYIPNRCVTDSIGRGTTKRKGTLSFIN